MLITVSFGGDMDYRPVGIFDSGMGGLTAVRVLREMLPGEDIAYLGDTARVPYGGRSVEELRRIAESDARFLRAREIKAMLVACGTVSSNCLGEVEATAGVPVIGVVKPAAAEAAAALESLGYTRGEAQAAIARVYREGMDSGRILKEALKQLATL